MFEIMLLVAATGGIATLARMRGGKPWLWGTLMAGGYVVVPFLVTFFAVVFWVNAQDVKKNTALWFYLPALIWVAGLFVGARYVLGRKYASPGGMWSCPNLQLSEQRICGHLRSVSASLPPTFAFHVSIVSRASAQRKAALPLPL